MPPIPVSLSTRLNNLQQEHKSTQEAIATLARPPATSQPDQDIDLSSKIHESLKQQTEELDLIKQELSDHPNSDINLSIQITRLGEDLRHSRARFRAAQVSSKKTQAAAKAEAKRKALFATTDGTSTPNGTYTSIRRQKEAIKDPRSGDETLVASSTVTDALRRTQRALETELSKSQFAQEIFDQSNEELRQLSQQYNDLDSLLAASKGLLGTLFTSQKSDTWYLETTIYLLIGTIAYLIFRRLLYGPLWWLVWLPLKLLWKTSVTTLSILGVFSNRQARDLGQVAFSGSSSSIMASQSAYTDVAPEHSRLEDQVNPDSEIEKIGKMVDDTNNNNNNDNVNDNNKTDDDIVEVVEHKKEERYRGDGTKLAERRPDQPVNPKKKVWNEPPSDQKEKEKDEL